MPSHEAAQDRALERAPVRSTADPPPGRAAATALADEAGEYAFLLDRLIDRATLRRAVELARDWGCAPHDAMLSLGWVGPDQYCAALGRELGVDCVEPGRVPPSPDLDILDATAHRPATLGRAVAARAEAGVPVALASPAAIEAIDQGFRETARLRHAINRLRTTAPDLSASGPVWLWQPVALAALIGLGIGGALIEPGATLIALTAVISLPFLLIVGLRAMSLVEFASAHTAVPPPPGARLPDAELPVYSVLVALYREAGVLPDLIGALSALDYPAAKLDVILALERDDQATVAAAVALELPGFVRLVQVPPADPRTKPKALNYALQMARGEYVVIYDAEDVPEPDQLRQALAAFRDGDERLVCVQARLNIHNHDASWLARGIMAQTPLDLKP